LTANQTESQQKYYDVFHIFMVACLGVRIQASGRQLAAILYVTEFLMPDCLLPVRQKLYTGTIKINFLYEINFLWSGRGSDWFVYLS
jgi:hypothetical protein